MDQIKIVVKIRPSIYLKKKESLGLTELKVKCPEVLKMWAGFSALHCKRRARMWSGVTPERTNLALSTNIQGVLQYEGL